MIIPFLLKLKNKHIILFFIISFLSIIIFTPIFKQYSFSIISLLNISFIFLWYLSIGMICQYFKSDRKKFILFNIAIIFISLYVLMIILLVVFYLFPMFQKFAVSGDKEVFQVQVKSANIPIFLFILQILIMLALFYSDYYLSKNIARIFQNKSIKFEEYSGIFLYFLFFPIGIWFIQPKVNKIYERYLAEKEQLNE